MSNYGPYGQPGQPAQQPYGPPGQAQPGQPQPWGRQPGTQPGPTQPGPTQPWGQPPAYGQPPYGQQGWGQQPPPAPRPELRRTEVPVVTTDAVPGREIATVIGPVIGVVARARELPPQARTGSMTDSYAAMLIGSRQDAVQQLVAMARAAGADAVVGLAFDSSEITQSLSEVVAYGTAVTLAGVDTDAAADAPSASVGSPDTPPQSNPWRPAD